MPDRMRTLAVWLHHQSESTVLSAQGASLSHIIPLLLTAAEPELFLTNTLS